MKFGDLLDEIKMGDAQYNELKLAEDIEEDVEILDEGSARYIKIKDRLQRIHNKIQEKAGDMKELAPSIVRVKRMANTFETVDKAVLGGIELTKAQARAKVISLRKLYEELTHMLRDRDIKRMITESGAVKLFGGALGTMMFATAKLEETSGYKALNKRLVPPYLKFETLFEQRFLKKADQTGAEPAIREEELLEDE